MQENASEVTVCEMATIYSSHHVFDIIMLLSLILSMIVVI